MFLLLALALAAGWLMDRGETLSGAALVIDGDSLRIGGTDVRIAGIDAPELDQTCERGGQFYACGEAARAALVELIAGATVECVTSERDRYGRSLARCKAAGRDLGAAMVERGLAVAYGGYAREERSAREAGRGLWAGSFRAPQDWRQGNTGGG